MTNQNNSPLLPQGWLWTTIDNIAEFIRGVSYDRQETHYKPGEGLCPILRANNINGELNFVDLVYVPLERVKDEQMVRTNDIILAMSSGSKNLVGKAAQAKYDFAGAFGVFCGLLRPDPQVEGKYIGFFFQSPKYRDEISRLSIGVNINNLRRQHIESMHIPLPPLPEQHRIVAKIEELFTKIDAAVEALNKVKAQVKSYRQAVLKHAFEGKLTEEWREAHKGEMEPASALLERIREERRKHTKGKTKDLPRIDTSDLPRGWVAVRVGDVLQKIPLTGKKLKQSQYQADGPLPVIDQGCSFIGGYTDKEELEICCDSPVIVFGDHTKIIKYVDFRFVVGGDGVKVLKPFNVFSPKLFYYFLQAVEIPEKGYARHYQFLEKAAVPLPPFPEQHRIVEEIERRFSVADEIEKAAERGLKEAERLRQSILKKAFEGKLVPQDPSEEPAEKLLERIKAEKGSTKDKSKSARSNRRQSAATQRRLI